MKNKFLCILLSLASVPVFAATGTDSHQIRPPEVTHGKYRGFVLASGARSLHCVGGGGAGCAIKITEQCPQGFTPSAATGIVSGGGDAPVKRIFLQPQPGQLYAVNDGYQLRFTQASIETFGGSSSPVTVSYSIYCS